MKAIEAAARLSLAKEFANQAIVMLESVPEVYRPKPKTSDGCDARNDLYDALAHLDLAVGRAREAVEAERQAVS